MKEKGGATLGYALDGEDNVACIDLDNCWEGGETSPLAQELLEKIGKTYCEVSLSEKGLHIFGTTKGMDIRTFSKDGDLEFYQKTHFIAMTGEGVSYHRLDTLDTPEIRSILESKCEKRVEWQGTGAGITGLSALSDKEVVEKAMKAKNSKKFKDLYEGVDIQKNHSNSDMCLMNMLCFWCNGDKEQMMRIFATSGLYRANKSPEYYECTATKAMGSRRRNRERGTPEYEKISRTSKTRRISLKMKHKGNIARIGVVGALAAMCIGGGVVKANAQELCQHDYIPTTYFATCTKQGYTEYTCALCGDSYKDSFINPSGHTYQEIEVQATCTEQGFTTHYCIECGYQYTDTYREATGHRYMEMLFDMYAGGNFLHSAFYGGRIVSAMTFGVATKLVGGAWKLGKKMVTHHKESKGGEATSGIDNAEVQ